MASEANGDQNLTVPVAILGGLAIVIAILALIFSLLSFTGGSAASDDTINPAADPGGYTKSLVQRSIEHYRAEGLEATLAYYNSLESTDGAWYVFIADESDILVVQPFRDDLRGTDINALVDPTGFEYGRDFTNATAAGQWTSYVFLHPDSGVETLKHSWLVREDGMIFGAGWWR